MIQFFFFHTLQCFIFWLICLCPCVNMFLSWSDLMTTTATSGKKIWTAQAQSPYSQTIQLRLNQIAGMRKLHSGKALPCCTAPSSSFRPKANRLGYREMTHRQLVGGGYELAHKVPFLYVETNRQAGSKIINSLCIVSPHYFNRNSVKILRWWNRLNLNWIRWKWGQIKPV